MFPSLGCSINLLISCACVPIHIERMVRGNIPRKPAVKKLRSFVPENENNTLVTAKGNTGDNLARRIILNSSFCRFSKICFTFGFSERILRKRPPSIIWAILYPKNEAIQYVIATGIKACQPKKYPLNKAIKVVGVRAKAIVKQANANAIVQF